MFQLSPATLRNCATSSEFPDNSFETIKKTTLGSERKENVARLATMVPTQLKDSASHNSPLPAFGEGLGWGGWAWKDIQNTGAAERPKCAFSHQKKGGNVTFQPTRRLIKTNKGKRPLFPPLFPPIPLLFPYSPNHQCRLTLTGSCGGLTKR